MSAWHPTILGSAIALQLAIGCAPPAPASREAPALQQAATALGEPELVKDLDTALVQMAPALFLGTANGMLFFVADDDDDGVVGQQLWRSDGTQAGTVRVKPFKRIARTPPVESGGFLYFAADDGSGTHDLWKTDGTEVGTSRLEAFHFTNNGVVFADDFPSNLTPAPGALFFTAVDDNGVSALCRTDGSVAGTSLLRSFPGGIGRLVLLDGILFFDADDGSHGWELWRSDGTAAGTFLVRDLNPGSGGSNPLWLTTSNGVLYFSADDGSQGTELWRSDGTGTGTFLVKDLNPGAPGSYPAFLVDLGGTLFFTVGPNGALWKSDGTRSGTVPVTSSSGPPMTGGSLNRFGGAVFFLSNDVNGDLSLWRSDGTEAGTASIKTVSPGGHSSVDGGFHTAGGMLFFTIEDSTLQRDTLWRSDGTDAGTIPLVTFPGNGAIRHLASLGPQLAFMANEGNLVTLWGSNGTVVGTRRLAALISTRSSSPAELTGVAGALFFTAGPGHSVLYRSDGTGAGTVQLFVGGDPFEPYLPHHLLGLNGSLYFVTGGLLRIDGMMGAPVGIVPGPPWRMQSPRVLEIGRAGNSVFFDYVPWAPGAPGHAHELWRTQGQPNDPVLLTWTSEPSTYDLFTDVDGLLFFREGTALRRSDGTPSGTILLKGFRSPPSQLTAVGKVLFFVADDGQHGAELWRSDGTPGGTVLVRDLRAGPDSSSPAHLVEADGALYFAADDGHSGVELWRSDGTSGGTILVRDINPGPASSSPDQLANVGGTVFFAADDGRRGRELWQSDGTESSTTLVKDLNPGPANSNPSGLTNVRGTLYFAADDGRSGSELWGFDGDGVVQVKDLNPGPSGSHPDQLTVVDRTLYFVADDGRTGRELWTLPLPDRIPPVLTGLPRTGPGCTSSPGALSATLMVLLLPLLRRRRPPTS